MRQVNGVYTRYINRRHQRIGDVFQGRYKSIPIDEESYLLEVTRYVVLNSVRTRMVNGVADWLWSCWAMGGTQVPPAWLETLWLLGQFSGKRGAAIPVYQDFVRTGTGLDTLWVDLRAQVFLGDENFVARMQAQLPVADRRASCQ